jgi:perosamine synthetase
MANPIPLSSISLTERERHYLRDAIESGLISSTGPYVPAFEAALARRLGTAAVVATASGTSALELILRALDIGRDDEVVVPAFTFVAPAAAVALVGATPVLADVSPESWTLDPLAVKRVLTRKTRAIVAVDVLGHPCDYDGLRRFDLPIIEDAAEAHGAFYKGRLVGGLGTAAVFSFHANKTISTGEGGCVATDNPSLAARVRRLNNFGMSPTRRYWHEEPGHNHRMTNLTAAIGLGQVERWDELVASRAEITRAYDEALAPSGVDRRPAAPWATMSTWLYTIASPHRDRIVEGCARRGIDARAVWPATCEMPAFRMAVREDYPVACDIARRALWLPTWSGMSGQDIRDVAAAVADSLDGCGAS